MHLQQYCHIILQYIYIVQLFSFQCKTQKSTIQQNNREYAVKIERQKYFVETLDRKRFCCIWPHHGRPWISSSLLYWCCQWCAHPHTSIGTINRINFFVQHCSSNVVYIRHVSNGAAVNLKMYVRSTMYVFRTISNLCSPANFNLFIV